MDPDIEEAEEDVFLNTEDPNPLTADEEGEDGEEEEEDEEEDARIFNAWMQRYRGGGQQEKSEEVEGGGEQSQRGRGENRRSMEPPVQSRVDRRASLPCPVRERKAAAALVKAGCRVCLRHEIHCAST